MSNTKLLLLLAPIIFSGCATKVSSETPEPPTKTLVVEPEVQVQTRTIDTSCSWVKPITMSKDDVLTDPTFNQIKAHDEMWLKKCGKK